MSKSTLFQSSPPQLIIAIDLGGSSTKVFYYDSNGALKVLVMEPLTADVLESEIKNHLQQLVGKVEPEDVAWVKVREKSQDEEAEVSYKVRAVGRLAKHLGGSAELKKAKFEFGVFKILAAIGVVRSRLDLPPKLTVALSVLMPWGEFVNRHQLKELLADCGSYYFNGERLSLSWWLLDFKPEGGGLGMLRGKQLAGTFKKKDTAVLMLGHRNASIVIFEKGVVQEGYTSEYGFVELVKRVQKKTPGYNFERLTAVIIQAGYEPDKKIISRLVKTEAPELQVKEVENTIAVIKDVQGQFGRDLGKWINEILVDHDVDEIVVGGGAASYLKPELEPRLKSPVVWELQNLPTNIADEGLAERLLDVYGVINYLRRKVDNLVEEQLLKQQNEQKEQPKKQAKEQQKKQSDEQQRTEVA
ncbi:MAG TPA: ParM/StbA family protein [Kamptonema sp.]|nr:ParM/StbA family protein [Kamptonema sp.]